MNKYEKLEVVGYEIEIPFGPAAGVLNGANEELLVKQITEVIKSPAGVVTYGSITWNGGLGNEGDVYYHNSLTGQTVNSMGLPNIGHERATAIYPELNTIAGDMGKLLIPSVSPGKGEDAVDVLPKMVEAFAEAGSKIVEVNISCPNKITDDGGREAILGHDLEVVSALDEEIIRRVGGTVLVVYKLPPYLNNHRVLIPQIANIIVANKPKISSSSHFAVGVNICNTIGGEKARKENGDYALSVPGNVGGLSGPATAGVGVDQLRSFRKYLPKDVLITSCMGIMSGEDVLERKNMGAHLTGAVTLFTENEKRGIGYSQTSRRVADQYTDKLLAEVGEV